MRRSLQTALVILILALGWYVGCFSRFEGRTVLMQASKTGDAWLVSLLLALGAEVNAVDRGPRTGGNTALTFAATYGHVGTARMLLDGGADPNPPNSALCGATASAESIAMMELLVSHGARVQEDNGTSVLRCIGARPDRVQQAQFLLTHGASVDSRYRGGAPILLGYAAAGWLDVLELLLQSGADINGQDPNGRTALMEAAGEGRYETVRFLLSHGADPTIVDSEGHTALALAWRGTESGRPSATKFRSIVSLLVSTFPNDG